MRAIENTPRRRPVRTLGGSVVLAFALLLAPATLRADATDVQYDSSSTSKAVSTTTSLSWSHTTGTGNDRLLVVGVSIANNSACDGGDNQNICEIESITYNGDALTIIQASNSSDNALRVEQWQLVAPDSTTASVVVTMKTGDSAAFVTGAVSFWNVQQVGPVRSNSCVQATDNILTVSVTSRLRDAVVDTFSIPGDTTSAALASGSPQVERWNDKVGTSSTDVWGGGSTRPAPGNSTSMDWDLGSTETTFHCAISIKPPNTPTAAGFVEGTALQGRAGNLLRWQTADEVGNLGFRVYREGAKGQRVALTPSLVAGSALLAGSATRLRAGGSYQWLDPQGSAGSRYWIEEVDLGGDCTWHGPFAVRAPRGAEVDLVEAATSPTSSPLLSRLADSPAGGSRLVERSALPFAVDDKAVSTAAAQWALAAAPAAKVFVEREGWHRVTRAQLAAAGYDPGANPTTLQLWVDGQQLPILVTGTSDGRFDATDAVEFFGQGLDLPSTARRAYWLVAGASPGLRVGGGGRAGGWLDGTTFRDTVERRDHTVYFAALTNNGERDNFYGPVVSATAVNQELSLPGVAAVNLVASLKVSLQGVSETPHSVGVSVNGHYTGEVVFAGRTARTMTFEVPQSWLVEGTNQVGLLAAGADDISLVDRVAITYSRLRQAVGNRLRFAGGAGSRATVSGFTTPELVAYDVTSPERPSALPVKVRKSGGGTFTAEVTLGIGGESRLVEVLATGQGLAPAAISANSPSSWNLATRGADLAVIAPASFHAGLAALLDRRRAEGLGVAVVALDDVFDEFSYGHETPDALRAFFARTAAWSTPVRYGLLVGDSSVDPRNYLGFGDRDVVPTRLVATNYLKAPSDDWFVADAAGQPRLALGRLPARDAVEAATMAAKLVAYEDALSGPWSNEALFVADYEAGGYDFAATATALAAMLPVGMSVSSIDLAGVDPAAARTALLAGLNGGKRLAVYTGHGSQAIWRESTFFSDVDALSLGNGTKLPFVLALDCLNGLFVDAYAESLAEALMRSANGGAVAVWASSALTDPSGQAALSQALFARLFPASGPAPRLGDAMREAKGTMSDRDVRASWILFGDPTQRLR